VSHEDVEHSVVVKDPDDLMSVTRSELLDWTSPKDRSRCGFRPEMTVDESDPVSRRVNCSDE
jgi:hypothetical protein